MRSISFLIGQTTITKNDTSPATIGHDKNFSPCICYTKGNGKSLLQDVTNYLSFPATKYLPCEFLTCDEIDAILSRIYAAKKAEAKEYIKNNVRLHEGFYFTYLPTI